MEKQARGIVVSVAKLLINLLDSRQLVALFRNFNSLNFRTENRNFDGFKYKVLELKV